jgi:hypothetical protein
MFETILLWKLQDYDLDLTDYNTALRYMDDKNIPSTIEELVHLICKIRFLVDYTSMHEILERIKKACHQHPHIDYNISYSFIFAETERYIVEAIGGYPSVWPWIREKNLNKTKYNVCLTELLQSTKRL